MLSREWMGMGSLIVIVMSGTVEWMPNEELLIFEQINDAIAKDGIEPLAWKLPPILRVFLRNQHLDRIFNYHLPRG